MSSVVYTVTVTTYVYVYVVMCVTFTVKVCYNNYRLVSHCETLVVDWNLSEKTYKIGTVTSISHIQKSVGKLGSYVCGKFDTYFYSM